MTKRRIYLKCMVETLGGICVYLQIDSEIVRAHYDGYRDEFMDFCTIYVACTGCRARPKSKY